MDSFFYPEPEVEQHDGLCRGAVLNDARIDISVDCQGGYEGEATPVRFRMHERPREVVAVLDRWSSSTDNCNFKVKGDDGGLYVLRHVFVPDRWELIVYAGGEC